MSSSTVGYIGLGNGYPMAACLGKAGYSPVVRDVDPNREKKFTDEYPKCKVAGTEEDGFGGSGILITILPTGKVVRDVLLGENGIARSLKAGMFLRL